MKITMKLKQKPVRTVDILAYEYVDSEINAITLTFATELPVHKIPNAIKKAVADFAPTPNGQALLERTCNCLNYGDLADVPNKYFEPHGLKLLSVINHDLTVDLNEDLLP